MVNARKMSADDSHNDAPQPTADQASGPAVDLRLPRKQLVLFLLLIAAAYVAPRVVAFWGIGYTSILSSHDPMYHLYNAEQLYKVKALSERIDNDPLFRGHPGAFIPIHHRKWPPGVYQLSLPLVAIFGPASIWTTQIINLLFTAIMVWGLIGIGTRMGSIRAGLLGALLAVLCPPLAASSWYYGLDYPFAAGVTMGVYLLLRTEGFSRIKASLVFAVWSVLAMQIKYNYPLYLLVPCLWTGVVGLYRGPRPRVALSAGVTLLTGVGFFALINWAPLNLLWKELVFHAADANSPATWIVPWSREWFLTLVTFAAHNYPVHLLVLALPGLLLLHVPLRATGVRGRVTLLLFLWGSWAVLTLMINKLERYQHPLYPVLCLVTAWWVLRMLPRWWGRVAAALVVAAYACVLVYAHHNPTPWDRGDNFRQANHSMYFDLAMPGREELSGLRERVWHPSCDLRPFVDTVSAWSSKLDPKQPLGLIYYQKPHRPGGADFPWGHFLLAMYQQHRDRFILVAGLFPQHNLRGFQRAMLHQIIIHRPGERPGALGGEIRVAQRRLVTLRCKKGTRRFVMSRSVNPHPMPTYVPTPPQ